jgi:hypothetical protein
MIDFDPDRCVRFRGKPLSDLTREEAIEALKQALGEVRRLQLAQAQAGEPFDIFRSKISPIHVRIP